MGQVHGGSFDGSHFFPLATSMEIRGLLFYRFIVLIVHVLFILFGFLTGFIHPFFQVAAL